MLSFQGALKNKGGGRTQIHYNAELATAQLLRITISINQLSVCVAGADWCQELAQRIAAHSSFRTGNLVAKVNNESESQVPSADVWKLTKSPVFSVGARGSSVQQHKEKVENLPEDLEVAKARDGAGFIRNVSPGQLFVAIHDIQLAGFGQKDGTQSWIVISRRVNKYVTEVPEENKKPGVQSCTGQLVAMTQQEHLIPSSSSSSTLPNKQRKHPGFPLEKTIGQLNEESCYLCFLPTSLK